MIEELHRIDLHDLTREEKLAFFINLYNMMAIHAIVLWGYPDGPLERRRFFGEFKYVIGGYSYSLSAIQNGVLRSNKRPPYNLIKPFGLKDKRIEVKFYSSCSSFSGNYFKLFQFLFVKLFPFEK